MKYYTYINNLIGKEDLRQLLSWSFTNYHSIKSCLLADELKNLGFHYASQAGISLNIEDLKVPFSKNFILKRNFKKIAQIEKIYYKGKITEIERFQQITKTWNFTSNSLKDQTLNFFKNYDPLNSIHMMSSSGARGNVSQVGQLVGIRGLMANQSGEVIDLPIIKNFQEGLTVTDYLISGYGARKGVIDTALKTANSGYLTRRLIDVAQDIIIREKDCYSTNSLVIFLSKNKTIKEFLIGRTLAKSINTKGLNIAKLNTQITSKLIKVLKENKIIKFYIRSPLTCNLYRAVCQQCYGWNLANETLIDMGDAIGILAGQSIGEPGTQLTMRTFHTGGVFISNMRQQIVCPIDGIIKLDKKLKYLNLRTSFGENVLFSKHSSSLIIIPIDKSKDVIELDIPKNTFIFPKNNQYISQNAVIGELPRTDKQEYIEKKFIIAHESGELFIPTYKKKILNHGKFFWILSGQFYTSPLNSFLNYHIDLKLNKKSYIFRSKIINNLNSFIVFIDKKNNLYQEIKKNDIKEYTLKNIKLKKLNINNNNNNLLLNINNYNYYLYLSNNNHLKKFSNTNFGCLILNSFKSLTGGTIYYDIKSQEKFTKSIFYYKQKSKKNFSIIKYRTLTWLTEESYREPFISSLDELIVDYGDFVPKDFEISLNKKTKMSGIISIKKNIFFDDYGFPYQQFTIINKSGIIYLLKKNKDNSSAVPFKKLYYPGELLFSRLLIRKLSLCECYSENDNIIILIRPVEIFEVPLIKSKPNILYLQNNNISSINIVSEFIYSSESGTNIRGFNSLDLVYNNLRFNLDSMNNRAVIKLKWINDSSLKLSQIKNLNLINYISPEVQYKFPEFCSLIQKNQYINIYTILGYIEKLTQSYLEIVKIKTKKEQNKQILLISNQDSLIINKKDFPNKKINDFIFLDAKKLKTGKIISENKEFFIIQKGQPYFFPNCDTKYIESFKNLKYKIFPHSYILHNFSTSRKIFLNYYNINKFYLINKIFSQKVNKIELKNFFLKTTENLYNCLISDFSKTFYIKNNNRSFLNKNFFNKSQLIKTKKIILTKHQKNNKIKNFKIKNLDLTVLKFTKQSLTKSIESIGLHSTLEDFSKENPNYFFCKNTEFIDNGKLIGLVHIEKEITSDIVQGLPKIDSFFEARKKNKISIKKKELLSQRTSLDNNFDFKKIGVSLNELNLLNPYKLLQIYFNYFGILKPFLCNQKTKLKFAKLNNNFEASYKSFKKIQFFILNSIQSVYKSQGVLIDDKHFEVIIKQMTTKVLITQKGNSPLFEHELVDLYHIKYINKVISEFPAYYIPLILGITKSALNNPSFLSSASFQETVKIFSKAAVEGQNDWLRGLKENIIVGGFVPAGTRFKSYNKCFKI